MDTPVQETPVVETPTQPVATDPFSLDEGKLASLSPEQRAALDPIFEEWRTRAKGELEKTGKTYEEKYRPYQEKAQALDDLVKDQRFQTWWRGMQNAATSQNPGSREMIADAKPQDFATPEEWQKAVIDASNNDPRALQEIQRRMFTALATPVVQEIKQSQQELRTTLEMKDLFERHSDAKELDLIGRNPNDPNDRSESLLEACLNWADQNGRSLEEGYARARKWADSLRVGAKQEALGLVQDKKSSVTSGPTTSKGGSAVVEVADADELMQKQMEAVINGDKTTRFVIRPAGTNNRDRWAQKT